MGQLEDAGGVLEQAALGLHDALLEVEQLGGQLLALALAGLALNLGLPEALVAAQPVPLGAPSGGRVQLGHGDGGIAVLGLYEQVGAGDLDALGQGLALLLEAVDLLLR